MAKTAKRIIDGILLEVQSYNEQAYDRLPDYMYWLDKLNTWRATTIRDLDPRKAYPVSCFQVYDNIPVHRFTKEAVINDVPIVLEEDIFYTDIPELVDYGWKEINHFGTDKNFSRKSVTAFNNNEGNKYTNHLPCYVLSESGRVYIKNLPTTGTSLLKMVAIFAHPQLVPGYVYQTTNYPVSEAMLPKIEYLLKREIFEYLGIAARREEKQEQPDEQE